MTDYDRVRNLLAHLQLYDNLREFLKEHEDDFNEIDLSSSLDGLRRADLQDLKECFEGEPSETYGVCHYMFGLNHYTSTALTKAGIPAYQLLTVTSLEELRRLLADHKVRSVYRDNPEELFLWLTTHKRGLLMLFSMGRYKSRRQYPQPKP